MPPRVPRKVPEPEQATDAEAAHAAAISLLARRDFATGELRQKLQQKGFDAEAIESVVAELTQERLVDDSRYASNYVKYHSGRGQGPVRIAADLRALGVADDVISNALAEGPDWPALAQEVRARKFGGARPADWPGKARQARFLQYRGFSSDHIRSALDADELPD